LPEKAVIIGGGYVGLEFAGFFAATGAEVTVIEMLPHIASGFDKDLSARLQQALKKNGVVFKTSHKVTAVDDGTVHYEDTGGAQGTVSADCIVNATGRVPVVERLGLEAIGVEFDRKGIKASDQGKTNVPSIWACGDVTGRLMLAHAAAREGIAAANNIAGKEDHIRYDAIPSVIYTDPEAASVGKTESELQALGIEYQKAIVPMGVSGRFLVENEGGSGMVKALVGTRDRKILGVHLLGNLSSEIIVAAAQMLENAMCVADAIKVVYPHPTVGEALKQALLEFR